MSIPAKHLLLCLAVLSLSSTANGVDLAPRDAIANKAKQVFDTAFYRSDKPLESSGYQSRDGGHLAWVSSRPLMAFVAMFDGTHDHEYLTPFRRQVDTSTFDQPLCSIQPYLLLYYGSGTVWFDDISVIAHD